MLTTRFVRLTLAASVPFNFGAASALALPGSAIGALIGLPSPVAPLYTAIAFYMVALFGGMYAWMALQPRITEPLLWVGAIGKAGVFVMAVCLWVAEAGPFPLVLLAAGDMAFASLWFTWLFTGERSEA